MSELVFIGQIIYCKKNCVQEICGEKVKSSAFVGDKEDRTYICKVCGGIIYTPKLKDEGIGIDE